MKRLLAAMVVVSALGALAVAVSSAQAAFEWLCNGRAVGSERCLVASENLEVLKLEDMGVPAAIECRVGSVLDEGWVGPGNEDEVTTIEFMRLTEECRPSARAENLEGREVENKCTRVLGVAVINLPWLTLIEELTEEGGVNSYWVLIEESGTEGRKQPGYLVECEVEGLKVDDACTSGSQARTALVLLLNLRAEGTEPALVSVFFNKTLLNERARETEAADCRSSLTSTPEDGLVVGEVLLEALEGGRAVSLEING